MAYGLSSRELMAKTLAQQAITPSNGSFAGALAQGLAGLSSGLMANKVGKEKEALAQGLAGQLGLDPKMVENLDPEVLQKALIENKTKKSDFATLLAERSQTPEGSAERKAYDDYIANKGSNWLEKLLVTNQITQGNKPNPAAFLGGGAPAPAPTAPQAPQGLPDPGFGGNTGWQKDLPPDPLAGGIPAPPPPGTTGDTFPIPGQPQAMGPLPGMANAPAPSAPVMPSAADQAAELENASMNAMRAGKPEEAAALRAQAKTFRERQDAEMKSNSFNEAQGTAAGYADRMQAAEQRMGGITSQGFDPTNLEENLKYQVPIAGNFMVTEPFQVYRQGQEDWVRAKLRKESGAVIAKDEMDREIKTFFPQPGDGPEVTKAKAQARQEAIQGMARSAGPAYKSKAVDYKSKYGLE